MHEKCLCCGSNELCGCQTRYTLSDLNSRTSYNLAGLLRDCYHGPMAEEKIVRSVICTILLTREVIGS